MDIQIKNQRSDSTIKSDKLYTQLEVDNLLEKKQNTLPSRARQIKQESQLADKQKRLQNKAVARLVKKSNRILVSLSSHGLPFDFFPTTLNIEEGRITVIHRHIFSSEVHSIDIKNISNIFINSTFFFSQLIIISKTFEENEIKISNLRSNEAIFARRIIEGLRTFENNKISTATYTKKELIAMLEELSTTEIVT